MDPVADRIDQLLDEPQLPELVARYYRTDQPFAGHLFDELGDNPWDRFTSDDALAITFLDVALEPLAVRALLDPAASWSEMLKAITGARKLWEATGADLAAADALWSAAVKALPGVGPTNAGKLLARKRPHLVPIYDRVIEAFLGPPPGQFWWALRGALQDEARRSRIDHLAGQLDRVPSTIRLLDVAIWMRCGRSRNAKDAREAVGLPRTPLEPR
jgi:hypothetical protein